MIAVQTGANTHWARHNQKLKKKFDAKSELRTPEQILKSRELLERKKNRNGRKKKGGGKGGGRGKSHNKGRR